MSNRSKEQLVHISTSFCHNLYTHYCIHKYILCVRLKFHFTQKYNYANGQKSFLPFQDVIKIQSEAWVFEMMWKFILKAPQKALNKFMSIFPFVFSSSPVVYDVVFIVYHIKNKIICFPYVYQSKILLVELLESTEYVVIQMMAWKCQCVYVCMCACICLYMLFVIQSF